jgi:hypothetical protein
MSTGGERGDDRLEFTRSADDTPSQTVEQRGVERAWCPVAAGGVRTR